MGVQSHPNTRGDFERLLKMHVCSKLAWTGFSFKKNKHTSQVIDICNEYKHWVISPTNIYWRNVI